jgi:hypothetical protein
MLRGRGVHDQALKHISLLKLFAFVRLSDTSWLCKLSMSFDFGSVSIQQKIIEGFAAVECLYNFVYLVNLDVHILQTNIYFSSKIVGSGVASMF